MLTTDLYNLDISFNPFWDLSSICTSSPAFTTLHLSIPFGIYHVVEETTKPFVYLHFQSLLGFILCEKLRRYGNITKPFNPFWDLSGVFLYLCSYSLPF